RIEPRSGEKIKRDAKKQTTEGRFAQASFERGDDQYSNRNPCQKRQIEIGEGQGQQDAGNEGKQEAQFPRKDLGKGAGLRRGARLRATLAAIGKSTAPLGTAGGFSDLVFDRAEPMRKADLPAAGPFARLGTTDFGDSGMGSAGFAGSAE